MTRLEKLKQEIQTRIKYSRNNSQLIGYAKHVSDIKRECLEEVLYLIKIAEQDRSLEG